MGWMDNAPAALLPGNTRYPLYRGLGGPQGSSEWVRKMSPPPGFDPRTIQPVASRYTEWKVIPVNNSDVPVSLPNSQTAFAWPQTLHIVLSWRFPSWEDVFQSDHKFTTSYVIRRLITVFSISSGSRLPYFFRIHFNITLPSTMWFAKWSLLLRFTK